MDFNSVAEQFLAAYYGAMQGTADNRSMLKNLYNAGSVVHYDGRKLEGNEIVERIDRIAPGSKFEYVNVEPIIQSTGDGILICVTGT